jgi:hypothetical protein
MPGLNLTLPQAARLFNLDAPHCERALAALIDDGELLKAGAFFVRVDAWRS